MSFLGPKLFVICWISQGNYSSRWGLCEKVVMHVELELAHAMLVASWEISDGRRDIEEFSSSALKLV